MEAGSEEVGWREESKSQESPTSSRLKSHTAASTQVLFC